MLVSLLVGLLAPGVGFFLFGRALPSRREIGLAGLLGLGFLGFLVLPFGLVQGGFGVGRYVIPTFALVLGGLGWSRMEPALPKLGPGWGVLGFSVVFATIGAISQPDATEWDSLAYHLAVPKLWLAAGKITEIPFIHHSNFPQSVDGLFLWGLSWGGGAAGAKIFSVFFLLYGALAIGSLAARRYGDKGAGPAVAAFASVPLVVWLSGTAYIDVAHGLYAGLGVVTAGLWLAGAGSWLLPALLLGLAAGSKYTGLQSIVVVGVMVLLVAGLRDRRLIRNGITMIAVAAAFAAPWYVKNVVVKGNPVYPFFYSVLGGKDWTPFYAEIYSFEQQTFGVGRPPVPPGGDYPKGALQPARLPHAVAGLATLPGRYINPNPVAGTGLPIGAVGFVILAGGLAWLVSGRRRGFETAMLGAVGLSLLMWFALSQQSRYILSLAPILAVLTGGAVATLGYRWLWIALGVQTLTTFGVQNSVLTSRQITALSETAVPRGGFEEPARWLNANVPKDGGVALFDEVFGYLLDVPYIWASPGHTTTTGWEGMQSGDDLATRLRDLGMTQAYLNLAIYSSNDPSTQRWIAAMGLAGPPVPYTSEEIYAVGTDLRNRWRVLFADAVARGRMRPVQAFGRSVVFEIVGR